MHNQLHASNAIIKTQQEKMAMHIGPPDATRAIDQISPLEQVKRCARSYYGCVLMLEVGKRHSVDLFGRARSSIKVCLRESKRSVGYNVGLKPEITGRSCGCLD